MPKTVTTQDVSRIAAVTQRQLQWWDENGILVAPRNGRTRTYEIPEVLTAMTIMELKRKGITLRGIRRLAPRI